MKGYIITFLPSKIVDRMVSHLPDGLLIKQSSLASEEQLFYQEKKVSVMMADIIQKTFSTLKTDRCRLSLSFQNRSVTCCLTQSKTINCLFSIPKQQPNLARLEFCSYCLLYRVFSFSSHILHISGYSRTAKG